MASKCLVNLCVLLCMLVWTSLVLTQQDPNQFDQILRDLDILTRQQLQAQANVESSTGSSSGRSPTTTSTTTSSSIPKKLPTSLVKSRLDSTESGSSSSSSNNQKVFRLPSSYDPNKLPRFSRIKPMMVTVNMTILHVNVDKHENTVNMDVEMIECWKDKRLRIRKSTDKNDSEDDFSVEEEEEDIDGNRQRKSESYLLEPVWASKIWHPVSRLQGNAQVMASFTVVPSKETEPNSSSSGSTNLVKQKTIEHENSIQSILVVSNETSAYVWLSLKVRIKIPMYECSRDESSLYPFDKVKCTLNIANVMYDRRNLVYSWQNINWLHNGYQTGEFYLRDLLSSITSEPLLDLDKDHSDHSTMRMEMLLKRQIGDYVLNVYLLHMFLLALCVASFWISIDNIVIRMSLSIIVLIIIKFQTIQTLKDDRHIVSALSIWTFGLSCLVILSLLCHILSYYSVQHKWNDKILNRLVKNKSDRPQRGNLAPGGGVAGSRGVYNISRRDAEHNTSTPTTPTTPRPVESIVTAIVTQPEPQANTHRTESIPIPTPILLPEEQKSSAFDQKWTKVKQNSLVWLNSIILNHSRKDEGYDRINLVDIISRVVLLIIYLLFVLIYFCTYVF